MCKFNKRKANVLQMAKILKNMNPAKILEENNGAKRMTLMPLSILLMGFAVSIFSYSGMGVDPFTALNMSVSAKLGISFGFYQMCVNSVILLLVAFVAQKLINIGTIVNMVGVGYVCEFFTELYNEVLPQNPHIIVKTIAMLLGVFLLSLWGLDDSCFLL